MPEVRIVAAALLFVIAFYWTIAASYEILVARKPPGIFGLSLVRPMNPEPVLTVSQWRKGGLFLLALAVVAPELRSLTRYEIAIGDFGRRSRLHSTGGMRIRWSSLHQQLLIFMTRPVTRRTS